MKSMSVNRLRPDPLRFVVGSVVAAVLLSLFVGVLSAPALNWAWGAGELHSRLAVGIVVGYGVVLSQNMLLFDSEDDDETEQEQTGLMLLTNLLWSAGIYTGTVAFGVSVILLIGDTVGLHHDWLVFAALLYPWWEEMTVSDTLPLPLPLSFGAITVYLFAAVFATLYTVAAVVKKVLDFEETRGSREEHGSEVKQRTSAVSERRRLPTGFINLDQFTGSSRSH